MTHARIGPARRSISTCRCPHGITALAGPPGAGKTLLLEIIAGFARADAGRILIDDAIVFDAASRVNLPARRRRCAYIPARDSLFPHMTVRQNLMFAADRWARLERHKRVAEMLERFELADALEKRPREIPPARRLRAEIARALMTEPTRFAHRRSRRRRSAAAHPARRLRRSHPARHRRSRSLLRRRGPRRAARGGRLVQRGAARDIIEHPESIDAARLLGIANLFPATIAALDPGRNQSRLECESFVLDRALPQGSPEGRPRLGRPSAPRTCASTPANSSRASISFPPSLLRTSERTRAVRLEFAGGIAAELSREQFERQKDNRSWQVEFPPAALRVF